MSCRGAILSKNNPSYGSFTRQSDFELSLGVRKFIFSRLLKLSAKSEA